jgi:hypothetical protein
MSTADTRQHRPLEGGPFAEPHERKQPRIMAELAELTELHRARSASYARMIDALFGRNVHYKDLESLPWLPVQLFKRLDLKSVTDDKIVRTLVSSGTSGAAPSRVFLDQETARTQALALARIVGEFIGPHRLPMAIVDERASAQGRDQLSARGAATVGFSSMGRDHVYLLDARLEPDWGLLEQYLHKHTTQPIMLFGFTFLVWQLVEKAGAAGLRLRFPPGSLLVHGGGWKKLQERRVSNEAFKAALGETLGIERVHNYYGMVEQVGGIFFECEQGWLHAPSCADVLVRDRMTLQPLPAGEQGLLQVLSTLPRSYPGHSLLTEDLGTIAGEDDCACGRMGARFTVAGRLPSAELRGCSDTRVTVS